VKAAHVVKVRKRAQVARDALLKSDGDAGTDGAMTLARIISAVQGVRMTRAKGSTAAVWQLLVHDVDEVCAALIDANQQVHELRREVSSLQEVLGEAGLTLQLPDHSGECDHLIARSTCSVCRVPPQPADEVMLRELARDEMRLAELDGGGGLEVAWGPWITSEFNDAKCHECLGRIAAGNRTRYSGYARGFVCSSCGKDGDGQLGEFMTQHELARRQRLGQEAESELESERMAQDDARTSNG
jgi:hypothetical protein